ATVRAMHTDRSPLQRDSTLQFPMQYGLGVMMGGDAFSLYGLGTRDAFGHLGLSTVVVYADPRRDLVVAYLNTGKPMFAHGMVTWYATLQRIVLTVPRIR
ncbi:MAG: hydrolase, partial [Myxococcota bacterium]